MIVYDKAKFHFETIEKHGLPAIQSYVHTAFFLGWLIDKKLLDDEFEEDSDSDIEAFRERQISAPRLFQRFDGCLDEEMLSPEGVAFANAYFDFERGEYLSDYRKHLTKDLPSEFHVSDTWENYEVASAFISERYSAWKSTLA